MKVNGRNIKKRLYKLSLLTDEITRAKHYRGYGVHSPFVYGLIRKVFMCRRLIDASHAELYEALLANGVAPKRAIQLQNAMHYCQYRTFAIDGDSAAEFNIATADYPAERLESVYAKARQNGTTLIVMLPYANRERRDTCRAIIAGHNSTTVDNRGYILIFNNQLPKQHFRL